ncbi:Homogentisate 1,2-dioxygenase [Tetrabaena socialis]|uniref:Homogentisate 1,2-dioxygenase n=1 Tax=Tetrabaena socialis TaxID=47790 RepID=A0A2J7ZVG2_9CHLO|nr:Homogentisate 1,2-dioxygenase [Tetrabaena socialis]|eukprot:PNH04228.1 Homogentisate 1,2-dioxygenase [Tetrabaena socialis]
MASPQAPLRYQPGFGNEFESEALPGALPYAQNNPRTCPYGLYGKGAAADALANGRAVEAFAAADAGA